MTRRPSPTSSPTRATGQITFDVDNDADGVTDSVWLDLGYPARADTSGRLYKPLFAFLVIGLNGRIPLNTAGNLAGASPTGATHTAHLGNSVSEIDPTYALQNANQGPAIDADPFNLTGIDTPPYTSNTQVDNAGIDVRLTQLRNLLAGTRPQPNPTTSDPLLADPRGTTNGDDNFVFGAWPGIGGGQPYYMPNGIADPGDILIGTNPPRVPRTTPAVPGRWGEAPWIPGVPITAAGGQVLNLVAGVYNNPVRAGYSFGITDLLNGASRAAADDNNNLFDPFPIGHSGEVNDRDLFDSAGGLLLPVDRMRRFVTPVDIDGSGRMLRWGVPWPAGDVGADAFGRVDFAGYFRPPGAAGAIERRRRLGDPRRDRLSLGRQRPLLHQRTQPGQSVIPFLPARRHQQPAPRLRGGQEPQPPRCTADMLPRPSAACPPIRTTPRVFRPATPRTTSTSAPTGSTRPTR